MVLYLQQDCVKLLENECVEVIVGLQVGPMFEMGVDADEDISDEVDVVCE